MTAMVRIGALRGYRELVLSLGFGPDALLRKFHIPPASLSDEDGMVSLRSFVSLLEASAQQFACPALGLRLAGFQDIGVLGPLSVGMQNSPTLAEALGFCSRFLFVQSPGISFTVLERSPGRPSMAELRFELLLQRPPPSRQFLDLSLGVAHRVTRLLGGEAYRPDEVHIPHQPIAPLATYRSFFGGPIHTGMPSASLLLKAKLLRLSTHSVNPSLVDMAESYLTMQFPEPGHALSGRVRSTIRKVLGTPLANKAGIARMLALHPRTLQRRLAEEQTSFDSIRDEVRRELAQRYLYSTQMPLIQVVGMLGISEPAALTRMCQRWFGKTPSAIRRTAAA